MTLLYQLIVLGIITLMGMVALVNMIVFPSLRGRRMPRRQPMVSVLLPARNEAATLGVCLSMLVEQDYPSFEVVVLDDNSDDGTADIAADWARSDPRIRAIRGAKLPDGWVGKCYACHQLSELARGDFLLFVDADTVHSRYSISAAMSAMEERDADLLTVIPHQVMKSLWELLILPLLHFSTFCYLPFPLVTMSKNPKFAMANGQFMLFKRQVYERIGGHTAVRSAMVEDVWLSRLVKHFGYRLQIMDGGDIMSCRMYTSMRDIWNGFSKNLFAGFRYSVPAIAAVILFNAVTSLGPFFFLLSGLLSGSAHEPWFRLVFLQVASLITMRWMLALRFRMNFWSAFLHPVAMIVLLAIAFNSCRWVLAAGGARWKGRVYDFRNHPSTS